MNEPDDLQERAQEFAEELTQTVRVVAPDCDPFTALVLGGRVSVRQSPGVGITLPVNDQPLLSLTAAHAKCLDAGGRHMAIEQSEIKVYASASAGGQPIFRYEYERDVHSAPAAHVHIHAHRDAFSHVLARSAIETRRASRRVKEDKIPTMQDVHFPVGGPRFRPCLEDVLEMLIDEFGIDNAKESSNALARGRQKWRRIQTRTVVRDDPESAVTELKSLGYDVAWQHNDEEPSVRWEWLSDR